MLKTIVLICHLNNPSQCMELHDNRGLHKTFNQCAERAYQLQQDLPKYLPHMRAIDFKCVEGKEGKNI